MRSSRSCLVPRTSPPTLSTLGLTYSKRVAKVMANRVCSLAKQMFEFCILKRKIIRSNPFHGIVQPARSQCARPHDVSSDFRMLTRIQAKATGTPIFLRLNRAALAHCSCPASQSLYQSASTIVTFASPPPSHIACKPYRLRRARRECTNVLMSLAPEAPSG